MLPVDEIAALSELQPPCPETAPRKSSLTRQPPWPTAPTKPRKPTLPPGGKFGFRRPPIAKSRLPARSPESRKVPQTGIQDLPTYELPKSELAEGGIWIIKLFTDSGLCASNGEARRLIKGGGAYLNETRITDQDLQVTAADFPDNAAMLKAGKKNLRRIVLA